MAESAAPESGATPTVGDADLLRVLVALAGRLAFPPERLVQIVGRPYVGAYNMCTGKLNLASIARASRIDKSNLRKAVLRWEEAGVVFRVGPDARLFRLYSLSAESEGASARGRGRAALDDSSEFGDGEADG